MPTWKQVECVIRLALAGVVAAATWFASAWLYAYQAPVVIKWIDRRGYEFHTPSESTVQPWWASPATGLVLLVGTTLVLSLVPGGRHLLARFVNYFATPEDRSKLRRSLPTPHRSGAA